MEQKYDQIQKEVVDAKNHDTRKYQHFTNNFYLLKSALRYYSVKKGMSFTSSKISDNFPIPVSVAGSGLSVLNQLNVIQDRTNSSKKRFMPENVNLEKLESVQEVLQDNHEINEYY